MFGKKLRIGKFDRWMMAVTFAEAGDPKTAQVLVGEKQREGKQNRKKRKVQRRPDQRPSLMA